MAYLAFSASFEYLCYESTVIVIFFFNILLRIISNSLLSMDILALQRQRQQFTARDV